MLRFILFTYFISIFASYQGCRQDQFDIDFHKENIIIDGEDNEAIWSKCKSYTSFENPWNELQDQGTIFKSFNDKNYLYFHFKVKDSLVICDQDQELNTAVEYSDRIELFFAKDSIMSEYCGLEIDPCGRLQQFYSIGYRSFVNNWKLPDFSLSDYKSIEKDFGYVVEGRISIESLTQMGLYKNGHIYLGVFRADRYEMKSRKAIHWISWKDIKTKKPNFHVFDGFRKLKISRH